MRTTSVEDAILASHQKAAEVRFVCAIYDRILLDVRQQYQFPVEPEKWAAGLAERLEFLNKDYRRTVRSNAQTLASRLRSLYGRRATASLTEVATTTQHETVAHGSSLVLVSKPSPAEPRVDESKDNLMCDLLGRVDTALELCTGLEDLIPRLMQLYESHGGATPLVQRVLLRRDIVKFRRGLGEALTYKKQIQCTIEQWRPYFEVLASETEMRRLLDEVHNQKLSTMAFLSDVTPVIDRFRALRDKRDDIMNKSTSLSFAHETTWLPLGAAQLSAALVVDELGQYDELLEEAKQQQAAHDDILLSLKDFKERSMSPKVVVGPRGIDIHLSRLYMAYVQFREIHFACNGVMRLVPPLLGALNVDIKALSQYEEEEVSTELTAALAPISLL